MDNFYRHLAIFIWSHCSSVTVSKYHTYLMLNFFNLVYTIWPFYFYITSCIPITNLYNYLETFCICFAVVDDVVVAG